MTMTDRWLSLASRATFLSERLTFEPSDDPGIEERLKAWCQSVASGEEARFARRLSWDGLRLEDARRAVAVPRLTMVPSWIGTLREVVELSTFEEEEPCLDPKQPLPFEEALLPFLRWARRRLPSFPSFDAKALRSLERSLLRLLTSTADQALFFEFTSYRSGVPPMERMVALLSEPRRTYLRFVVGLRGEGLLGFFEEYPVLARLLVSMTENWVEAVEELVHRLEADRPFFRDAFGWSPGRVLALRSGLSDPHRGGRGVIVLEFEDSRKLVYKPKSLDVDAAYHRLVDWLSERAGFELPTLKVLARDAYGWSEFAERRPCRDEAEAGDFFRRSGMLLGLMYLLSGSDLHFENLIPSGPYPMPIDLETILGGVLAHRGDALDAAGAVLQRSVLAVGLLPNWVVAAGGNALDFGGLSGELEQTVHRVPQWREVNTDTMALEFRDYQMKHESGPSLGETPLSVDGYAEELVDGFSTMVRLIERNKPELRKELASFSDLLVRFVPRPTQLYADLRQELRHPRFLQDGARFEIGIEKLARPWTRETERPLAWPLLEDEKRSLGRGDIPFFAFRSSAPDLLLETSAVEGFFQASSYESLLRKLEALDEEDLELQLAFIRGSLLRPSTPSVAPPHEDAPPLSDAACLEQAEAIARLIRSQAIAASGGGLSWLAPQIVAPGRFQIRPLSAGLYDGLGGVALFFSALFKVTGKPEYREGALGMLQPLLKPSSAGFGLGGFNGVPSVCYSLARCADFLEEPSLRERALFFAHQLTPEQIEKDQTFDVLSGSAGAILALLAVHASTGDECCLETASLAGDHLLASRSGSAWVTMDGKCLGGFSHGASGIAPALLKLCERTGNEAYRAAAEEAIEWEATLFSPEVGNWRDLRGETGFGVSWCHGAPGIALGRFLSLPILDTPRVRADLEVALSTTRKIPLVAKDPPCCGNTGRADILLEAGRHLERPELIEASRGILAHCVFLAERNGGFTLDGLPRKLSQPAFFTGLAGIGYMLLRQIEPLPCVLSLS